MCQTKVVIVPSKNDTNKNVTPTNSSSVLKNIKYVICHISVEPLLIFYLLPSVMNYLVCQNLYLEKACRVSLRFNSTICDALSTRNFTGFADTEEAEVQKLVSKMMAIKIFLPGFFPILLVMFAGSWSDRHKRRKPLILAPIFGELIGCFLLILSVVYFEEIPLLFTVLADSLPLALMGGYPCLFLGLYSYVSSTSDEESRTVRVGTVSTLHNTSMLMGIIISGIYMQQLGFLKMYSISASMMATAFIYGFIVIKDENVKMKKKKSCSLYSFVKDFFDPRNIMNISKVCFGEQKGNRKYRIMAVLVLMVFIMGPFAGEYPVLYLSTRYRFGWNEYDFSIYFIVQAAIQICGSIFALTIFSKIFKWHDASLGILAAISAIAGRVLYAMATNSTLFYTGAFFEVFYLTCHIAVRSLMAKIVPQEELGQSYSVFGICEAFMQPLFGPLYTMIYNYTIDYLPGSFFLVTAIFKILAIFIFIWIFKEAKRSHEKKEKATIEERQELNRELEILEHSDDRGKEKSIDPV